MEKTKATADQQKRETVTLAEGNAESARLKGEGDARAIESIGTATAEAYEKQKTAVGPQAIIIMAIELTKHYLRG